MELILIGTVALIGSSIESMIAFVFSGLPRRKPKIVPDELTDARYDRLADEFAAA